MGTPIVGDASATGTNPPVIVSSSARAGAGQVISLQGAKFGDAPVVYLDSAPNTPLSIINRVGTTDGSNTGWLAVQLPATLPSGAQLRIRSATGTSAALKLNVARPMHLDALQLTPGGPLRVFGRNLMLAGSTPSLVINGVAAPIDSTRSSEHMLTATVPASLVASRAATITVDNGNGSGPVTLDRSIAILRAPGNDPFALGVSWAIAFAPIASHVIDTTSDLRLGQPVRCDGTTDDTASLQRAIVLASNDGGGIVQLPAGTCRLTDWLPMKSRVVLQGAGKSATEIRYTGNYPVFAQNVDLIGLRNLTLTHDSTSEEGPLLKDSTRIVIQNVAINLGHSRQMYLTGNQHVVVKGSDIVQAGGLGLQGPFTFDSTSGLVFENNMTRWVNGAPTFGKVHDSVIVGNHFSRDATDPNAAGFVHSLTVDFAYRIAIIGNTFDVINGPVVNPTRNDGETILTEGGSSGRTENLGTVASATSTTLTDPSNTLNVDPFGAGMIPENYGIAIVGGTGAGQTRRVMSYASSTVTVDRAWDMVPDTTSRYATFVWGLEKSLIEGNQLSQNPRGIWIYGTSVREVDIVNNQISEGGGIYLRSTQDLAARRFTIIYDVAVTGNRVANTTGHWMSYVISMFVNMDARDFGIASLGVEMRNNQIVGNVPNVSLGTEEYANLEGFMTMMRLETSAPYQTSSVTRLLGTLLTGNLCQHCDVALRVGTGAGGTTMLNSQLIDVGQPLDDWATTSLPDRSTNTLVR